MSKQLIVEFSCNGNGCGEIASVDYQNSYEIATVDLEEMGWLIVNDARHQKDDHYCPECKNKYGG